MELITLSHNDVLSTLPDRKLDSHKGNYGKILLLCGSEGYTGAPALAALGALRSGAGLVYLGVPRCIYNIESIKLTEPIIFPLPDSGGKFCDSSFVDLYARLDRIDAILLGPGIGRSNSVTSFVCRILQDYHGTIVLDADGINAISEHIDILRRRTGTTILTPHAGEFARLGGEVSGNRIIDACKFAADNHVIVLLKGHNTIITDGYTIYQNLTGNPGMATGGSGDVLSGIIVSLVGQGIAPLEATACAAWLHGKAGDICAQQIGQYGMIPSDYLTVLPRLMK